MTSPTSTVEWLRTRLGEACEDARVEGDHPLLLVSPADVYVTIEENHQLFCVGHDGATPVGRREHVASCEPGQLLLSIESDTALLLTGIQGSRVLKIPAAALWSARALPGGHDVVDALFERWVKLLVAMLPQSTVPPRCRELAPSDVVDTEGAVRAKSGVAWLQGDAGITRYLAMDVAKDPEARAVTSWPLTELAWAHCAAGSAVAHGTAELLEERGSWGFADSFHALVVELLGRRRKDLESARLGLDEASHQAERRFLDESLRQLASVGSGQRLGTATSGGGPLARACSLITTWLAMPMPHIVEPEGTSVSHMDRALSLATGVRTRSVLLEGAWWKEDNGALLGFTVGEDEALRPIALLPARRGYELHDPETPMPVRVTRSIAEKLHPQAHQFYASLPARALGPLDVFRFASKRARGDIAFVFGLGIAVGGIGTLLPVLTGLVFDRLIPSAERGLLAQLSLVLIAIVGSQFLFDAARGLRLVRAEARMDTTLEAAVWDRLLSLPLPFFRNYTAGDLAARAGGIGAIRQALSGAALSVMLGAFFSIWNVAFLFVVNGSLALAACGLVAIASAVAGLASWAALRRQRILVELDGKIGGLLLQLLGGIAKLRVTGSEDRAFGVWSRLFARRRDADLGAGLVDVRVAVFQSAFPLLCNMTLFWLLLGSVGQKLSTGMFLAFMTAFNVFLISVLDVIATALQSLVVVPLYERAAPILVAEAETREGDASRITLKGAIEVSHVSFRYTPQGPLILHDVSLKIEANEFVAIVGPSGSGKSTLLRMLLGFEKCTEGGVFYDEQALTGLDVRVVRQQVGVVTQNTRVLAGDIYTNIVGNTGFGLDDAWVAAKKAAFDADIEAMPMGMHTVISQGGGTLSGGQRQRLLIARALVAQPRILFFDEATSALDNLTQAVVSESLERLRVTRIAIAHRLSTVRHADKIVVLEAGRVVQVGRFEQLIEEDGPFRTLAKRQTV
jgi:NHLM bacteriocin system ABC transporter ATP-binding protein